MTQQEMNSTNALILPGLGGSFSPGQAMQAASACMVASMHGANMQQFSEDNKFP